ncbi:hypothetical protein EJB05_13575 [Eragrostis curvula]|uniref:DUF7378 domain-containing protein n=1 Tax=Eragrostis curvula TaxID=38414 RepID=A0A5J9VWY1_9POAL|nr:hypothetical protein EJB05_13575 [Eragrostis curvula]
MQPEQGATLHTSSSGPVLGPAMKGSDQGITVGEENLEAGGITVGEENLKAGNPRCLLWVMAVYLPMACIGGSLAAAYVAFINPHAANGRLWPLSPIILLGIYMALVSAMTMHVNLHLPRTPVAVRDDILEVGLGYVGFPLIVASSAVACFDLAWWAVVAVVCLLVIVIFAAIAFWVRLVRTYKK